MANFTTYTADNLENLKEKLKTRYSPCTFFENAAQKFAESLYSEFSSSVILARVYVTIPSQDFVSSYGIRTVYGMGSTYLSGAFAVGIIFTNEALTREQITPMASLFLDFKFGTSKLGTPKTWLNA